MPPARIVLWVASVGALALLARTLLIAPLPTWFAVVAFVLYALLCTLGVLIPQLEMYGDVEWRGDPGTKRVALTFDDGPNPTTTRKVLEILARGGHKATFFVVGRKAKLHPELVREIHEAGHALGMHGYEHDRLYSLKPPSYVAADIERTRSVVQEACGVCPSLFRPPVGYVSSRTHAGAKRAKARLIAWSARGVDGLGPTDAERVFDRIERKLTDGAIVLLHDAAERDDFEPAGIEALPRILEALEDRGLRAVTVEELLEDASTTVLEAAARDQGGSGASRGEGEHAGVVQDQSDDA
jgi:peptidoglycan/xylan/chitin deacetylase (PgdA/CDA1 family)